jgi:hypothetical protein
MHPFERGLGLRTRYRKTISGASQSALGGIELMMSRRERSRTIEEARDAISRGAMVAAFVALLLFMWALFLH